MTRLIQVNYCWECPHFMEYYHNDIINKGFCSSVGGKKIENINRIPEWCPYPLCEKKKTESLFKKISSFLKGK